MKPKIKARRGYQDSEGIIWKKQVSRHHKPVAVIPIDQPEALVEQVAKAQYGITWSDSFDEQAPIIRDGYLSDARIVLESLGILTKPTTKRKGRKA